MKPTRTDFTRIFLVVVLACAGCGDEWKVASYPAKGTISINGKAPAGALVELFPTTKTDERKSRPWGLVKDDGTYVLSTYDGEPGAPAGDYLVTIKWPPDASKPSMVDKLKSRYSDPKSSRLKFKIKPEDNSLPPIELDGVKIDEKASLSAADSSPIMTAEPRKPSSKSRH